MPNQWQILANNSGLKKEKVQSEHETVLRLFGQHIKDEEKIWWLVCKRLDLTNEKAPGVNEGRKSNKTIQFSDLNELDDNTWVNVSGFVTEVDASEEGVVAVRLIDNTASKKVKLRLNEKTEETWDRFQSQPVQTGQFVEVHNVRFGIWNPSSKDPNAEDKNIQTLSMSKNSEWFVRDGFDPEQYFPSVGAVPLQDKQPCVLRGVVMNAKPSTNGKCPQCGQARKGGRNGTQCWRGHSPNSWVEVPSTGLFVISQGSSFDVFLDGDHTALEAKEVVVVGTYSAEKGTIRASWFKPVGDLENGGKEVMARTQAQDEVVERLKKFPRLPRQTIVNVVQKHVGSTKDAEQFIRELVKEGKLVEVGPDLKLSV